MATILLFLLLSAILTAEAQQQQSIVSPDSSLTPTSTNSSWPSPSGLYAFGFYKQGNGYAVGIFLAGIPQKTVVWTANRDNPPVPADVTLNFTSDGRLVLQSTQGTVTIVDGGATSASMLDTGNFVVYNSHNNVSESNQSTGIFRALMQQDGFLALYPLGTPYTREYGYWSSEHNVIGAQNNATLNLGVDDGFLRLYSHNRDPNGAWSVIWSPSGLDRCTPMGICGLNAYCIVIDEGSDCNCLPGFEFVDKNKTTSGCTRNFIVEICEEKRVTYAMEAVLSTTWENGTYSVPLLMSSQTDCQNACLEDCNCEAALFQDGACRKQRLPLRFGRRSTQELEKMTDNFKEELGRGSFGIVYKGSIRNGQKFVAVKRLEKLLADREREFQTEMKVIGRTHHKNLICLLGYCHDGPNRLLVYEYMSNGSLADILFTPEKKLSWDERIEIACNIARGILYLHEECMSQIIHCDIKPQNILMDENRCAKISDFGLAKLMKLDQSKTLTGIRGTRGYVAPEWHRRVPHVTVKVDVYSFGIVLLEIICCRKSVDCNLPEKEAILEEWTYNCFEHGELSKLLNDEEVDNGQLERMVKVALWCILDDPSLRPSMKKVLLMLEGTMDIPIPPNPTSVLSVI
uniref:non-specific serine/threonine protein kinase n=1 Tax=Fagus sylvatica TaxID=28930 RepID=A0A2N9EYB9_FAGSY